MSVRRRQTKGEEDASARRIVVGRSLAECAAAISLTIPRQKRSKTRWRSARAMPGVAPNMHADFAMARDVGNGIKGARPGCPREI
jgi:hypothetical protein